MGKTRGRSPIMELRSGKKRKEYDSDCKCTNHKLFILTCPGNGRTYSTKSNDVSPKVVRYLVNTGHLGRNCRYVCDGCSAYAKRMMKDNDERDSNNSPPVETFPAHESTFNEPFPNPDNTFTEPYPSPDVTISEPSPILDDSFVESSQNLDQSLTEPSDNSVKSEVKTLIELIENNDLTEFELNSIMTSLGKHLNKTILQDTYDLQGTYKKPLKLDTRTFLKDRPKALINFMESLTGVSIEDKHIDPRKLNTFCFSVESIYRARNLRFVGPFSFSQGLVQWSFSGSKAARTLESASSACGSVTTMKNWMEEAGNEPNKIFEIGDVDLFADNTQKKGKTIRVKENGTTPINVATNVVFIQSNPPSNVQSEKELKPGKWSGKTKDIGKKILEKEKELCVKTFEPYKFKSQTNSLKTVSTECHQTDDEEEIEDHVSLFSKSSNLTICMTCKAENLKDASHCIKCNFNFDNFQSRKSLYGDVPDKHPKEDPSIKLGEVIGVNPNSYKTIKLVLENLRTQADIGGARKWTRIGFDGVPYRIANEIINNVVVCTKCQKEFENETAYNNHKHSDKSVLPSPTKKFDDILLVAGSGHIEKNLILAIFQFCKPIFIERFAHVLGFRSRAAKDFITNCGDHHLSWQILLIMFESFSKELFHVYVTDCMKSRSLPTIQGFKIWKNDVVNPNYHFIYDVCYKLFLGIICFRSGIRRNNSEFALAGRQLVAPIMFTGNHGIYQPLLANDMKIRIEAPLPVKQYIERNESFDRSGDHLRGEGGDYVTEVENKHLKSHLSPGVPTLEHWRLASRNHQMLKENRDLVFERSGVKDPAKTESSIFNFSKTVQVFRSLIRESGMLEDPFDLLPLRTIDDQPLHHKLVNFYSTCLENYEAYLENEEVDLTPVFVTYEDELDYNNMKNWTNPRILSKCQELLKLLPFEKQAGWNEMYKKVKNTNKDHMITFSQKIEDELIQENFVREEIISCFETDEVSEM